MAFLLSVIILAVIIFVTRVVFVQAGLKKPVVRSFVVAIVGALLFQVANRVYVGFWDPFSEIAFFVSLPLCLFIVALCEMVPQNRASRR